jgi:hypothetical protein
MKTFNDYDRFDLEQGILDVWGTTDLIDEYLREKFDGPESMTEDEEMNKLSAIKEVLNMKCQRLWDGFEMMVKTKQFTIKKSLFDLEEDLND